MKKVAAFAALAFALFAGAASTSSIKPLAPLSVSIAKAYTDETGGDPDQCDPRCIIYWWGPDGICAGTYYRYAGYTEVWRGQPDSCELY
jgi:hypothetical protein